MHTCYVDSKQVTTRRVKPPHRDVELGELLRNRDYIIQAVIAAAYRHHVLIGSGNQLYTRAITILNQGVWFQWDVYINLNHSQLQR